MGWTLLTHTGAGSADSNNVTTTGINTAGASLLVAAIADFQNVTASTISDSASNTWTALTTFTDGDATTGGRIRLFYVANPTTNASHTATASSTGAFPAICFASFSGGAGTPFDQQNGAGTATGATVTTQSPGSITPTQSNELIVSAICLNGAVSALSVGSSLTLLDSVAYNGATNFGLGIAYLVQGAAAAINPAWSWTTAVGAVADIASFKAAGVAARQQALTLLGLGV